MSKCSCSFLEKRHRNACRIWRHRDREKYYVGAFYFGGKAEAVSKRAMKRRQRQELEYETDNNDNAKKEPSSTVQKKRNPEIGTHKIRQ